jgi:phage terminase large subunit-like protein
VLPTIQLPTIDTGPFHFGGQRGNATLRPATEPWDEWLTRYLPAFFSGDFAPHHVSFWQWVEGIERGERPAPFVAVWPRGGGKSTNAEAAVVRLAAKDARSYFWYVCETQDQADEHVANIAAILESPEIERRHPALSRRRLNKYGHSRGWRRNRLMAESGLVVDALGMDTARRGFKVEERRPDAMVFDDIDGELDTPATTEKKETVITKKLLPAGAPDLAVLVIQNLVTAHGIVARLSDGRAPFLANRVVSGPIPAIDGLITENVDGRDLIIQGRPTWDGQDVTICQSYVDDWGLPAFLAECQHDVYGGLSQIFQPAWWSLEDGRNRYDHTDKHYEFQVTARYLFVDTAFKDKSDNDESAIAVLDLLRDYRVTLRWMWHERILSAYLPDRITDVALQFRDKLHGIIIEDKGSGTTSIQTLRASSPAWIAQLIIPFEPKGAKEYRARNAAVWCPRDVVLFPYPHSALDSWYADFLDSELGQLFRFPNAPHDDMVDTLVMGILYLEHYLKLGWQKRTGQFTEPKTTSTQHTRVSRALQKQKKASNRVAGRS